MDRRVWLYGIIGALSAAQGWPKDASIDWRFFVAVAAGGCLAVKAALSPSSKKSEPEPDAHA